MYVSPHFEERSVSALRALMRAHPLAALVTHGPDGIGAEHIPMMLAGNGELPVLHGHVARANPVWRNVDDGSDVLAIFQGPNRYISPSWYLSKAEHGKVVPTWNYLVVHASGTIRWQHDAGWLRQHVEDATSTYERGETPWRVSDAPAEYVDRMLSAIVGFEILVTGLQGKWKLNQNRTAADRQGVVDALGSQRNTMAEEMAESMSVE
jgi:transcriptional regulator